MISLGHMIIAVSMQSTKNKDQCASLHQTAQFLRTWCPIVHNCADYLLMLLTGVSINHPHPSPYSLSLQFVIF